MKWPVSCSWGLVLGSWRLPESVGELPSTQSVVSPAGAVLIHWWAPRALKASLGKGVLTHAFALSCRWVGTCSQFVSPLACVWVRYTLSGPSLPSDSWIAGLELCWTLISSASQGTLPSCDRWFMFFYMWLVICLVCLLGEFINFVLREPPVLPLISNIYVLNCRFLIFSIFSAGFGLTYCYFSSFSGWKLRSVFWFICFFFSNKDIYTTNCVFSSVQNIF